MWALISVNGTAAAEHFADVSPNKKVSNGK